MVTKRYLKAIATLLFLFFIGSCAPNHDEEESERLREYVVQGKVQYMEGDYNSALSTLQKVLGSVRDMPTSINFLQSTCKTHISYLEIYILLLATMCVPENTMNPVSMKRERPVIMKTNSYFSMIWP